MKGIAIETLPNSFRAVFLPSLTLALLITIILYLQKTTPTFFQSPEEADSGEEKCNIFKGDWVPHPAGPYYTNETKCEIDDRQNCMKAGRPDGEFMKWRWRPEGCELPPFDAGEFLEVVRGKTMAFVGDSVGRNQMQSLVCLLASAANPVDVSYTPDKRFMRWLYPDYNFTLVVFFSPYLVKTNDSGPNNFSGASNLYLDEADEVWESQVKNIDILILSAGQWFFRPCIYYEKGQVVGCHWCKKNITELGIIYPYRMVFRTAFKTILNAENFNGMVILRTFSPSHFENGDWNKGGNCARTRPFTKEETVFEGYYDRELHRTQVEEFRVAAEEGRKRRRRGLKFRLLDTTKAMVMRPDGHPNYYGHEQNERNNNTIADCVHWCLPGPVDTWNEFLFQVLKMEIDGSITRNT